MISAFTVSVCLGMSRQAWLLSCRLGQEASVTAQGPTGPGASERATVLAMAAHSSFLQLVSLLPTSLGQASLWRSRPPPPTPPPEVKLRSIQAQVWRTRGNNPHPPPALHQHEDSLEEPHYPQRVTWFKPHMISYQMLLN